jgi:hypothetical protein
MKIQRHESGRELHLYFWLFGWFGSVKLPSSEFSGVWMWKRIKPLWYRVVKMIPLFLTLIKPWDNEYYGGRIKLKTAIEVCRGLLA